MSIADKYSYFLFDLDRTLWAFDKNSKSALYYLADKYDICDKFSIPSKDAFFDKYKQVNQSLWVRYEAAEITKDYLRLARFYDVFEYFLSLNGQVNKYTKEELISFSDNFSTEYLNKMNTETALEPNAVEVLEYIKDMGGKIAIVTNGFKEVQHKKMVNADIAKYVDAVIISEVVGAHKPNPVIFIKSLESLCGADTYNENKQAIRSQTLMVGDDFTNDIEGAQVFGIDQFYYNPKNKPCDGGPTYQGDNLINLIS